MKIVTQRNITICTFIVVCLCTLLYNNFTGRGLQIQDIFTNIFKMEKGMVFILQWTSPTTKPFIYWGRQQREFIKRKCKINKCYVTANRLFFPSITQFDAIAFHGPEIKKKYVPSPSVRSPHQKYVFVSIESSHYYPICAERYNGFFNWTWTYKLDSDLPYGYITVRNVTGQIIGPNIIMHWLKLDSMQPIDQEMKIRLGKKSKAAAWFVSNCQTLSKREAFVAQLNNELRHYGLGVDVFGSCIDFFRSKKCPKTRMNKCMKMIEEKYYFYLSLENSISQDYVTEKLLTALNNYAVPVVLGGANYTRFMTEGIYLHGGKLKPSQLAKEMNDIIKDKERYYNFFKWRNHYSYHHKEDAPDSDDLCKMCEMLHNQTLVKKYTVYKDFQKWWNVPKSCYQRKRHVHHLTDIRMLGTL